MWRWYICSNCIFQRLLWAVTEGLTATALLVAGGKGNNNTLIRLHWYQPVVKGCTGSTAGDVNCYWTHLHHPHVRCVSGLKTLNNKWSHRNMFSSDCNVPGFVARPSSGMWGPRPKRAGLWHSCPRPFLLEALFSLCQVLKLSHPSCTFAIF